MLWLVAKRGNGPAASAILQRANGRLDFLNAATSAAMEDSPAVLQALVDHGWDVKTHRLHHLGDALQVAIRHNNLNTVQWLLEHDCPTGNSGMNGYNTLGLAAKFTSPAIISLLVKKGVAIPQTRALGLAAQAGRLDNVSCLIDFGAAVNEIPNPDSPEICICATDEPSSEVGTALHDAAAAGQIDAVAFLLEKGADVRLKDHGGRTAWRRAKDGGHAEVLRLLEANPNHVQPSILETVRGTIGL
ncbi:ankyrin repeat-containing domain protein [Mycena floridula]|nr:ankyrin repeat-containing domain protein [Mycena floridula]KAJ7582301.1 ankyrin repeat-containing domain protein [Mycena floridula]